MDPIEAQSSLSVTARSLSHSPFKLELAHIRTLEKVLALQVAVLSLVERVQILGDALLVLESIPIQLCLVQCADFVFFI